VTTGKLNCLTRCSLDGTPGTTLRVTGRLHTSKKGRSNELSFVYQSNTGGGPGQKQLGSVRIRLPGSAVKSPEARILYREDTDFI
jgi:hypothetical protein